MRKQVLLIGGGGHGRVVLDALLANGTPVTGILDPRLKVGDRIFGVPVVGDDQFLARLSSSEVLLVNGIGANPCVHRRKKAFENFTSRGFSFMEARHPSAVTGAECALSESSQIMAGVVLQNRVRLGDNVVINTRASIDHDCTVGPHAFVAPGVVLSGDVSVGESVFIGAGAVVLPGVVIGAAAVIGAGAVVIEDVPDKWVVAGNPAAKIGMKE